jgi:molecular chaperone DnaJ
MATTERDYYELLGVEKGATDDVIKRAFRSLARELHPDVSDAPDAQERFRQVAEAYEVLSDPERRRTYDRFGHAGLRGGGFQPSEFDLGNLSDVFAAFFGEGLFGGGGASGPRPTRGADVAVATQITLAEALTGVSVKVTARVAQHCGECEGSGAAEGSEITTCPGCGGAGRVRQVAQSVFGQVMRTGACPRCEGSGREIEKPCVRCDGEGRTIEDVSLAVDIPPGIHDGQRIRIRGEGHAGALSGPSGDAYVHIGVAQLDGVERDGDDLITVADLTMTQAAIGATVDVVTPEGPHAMDVPAGTQPGDLLRVRGRGMPSLDTGRRGDLLVHVGIRIPRKLTAEQRAQVVALGEELGTEPYAGDEDEGFFARLRGAFR